MNGDDPGRDAGIEHAQSSGVLRRTLFIACPRRPALRAEHLRATESFAGLAATGGLIEARRDRALFGAYSSSCCTPRPKHGPHSAPTTSR
jgi:hypothetical protein